MPHHYRVLTAMGSIVVASIVACSGGTSSGGSSGESSSGGVVSGSGAVAGGSGAGTSSGAVAAGSGSVSSSGQPAGGGNCSVAAGTYTIAYSVKSGTNCPAIPSNTTTVAENETPSTIMMEGTEDAGANCTETESGCTLGLTCDDSNDAGTSVNLSLTLTFGTNSASGTETVSDSFGGTSILNCTYNVSYTKN